MLKCSKCDGKIMMELHVGDHGHVELFCIICGKRWECHRNSSEAKVFNRLGKRRESGLWQI